MEYKFRKNAEPGEWCSILLPLCLLSFVFTFDGKYGELYTLLFTMCLWLFIFDFLKKIVFIQKLFSNYSNHYLYIVASLPVSIFVWKFFSHYSCFFHVYSLSFITIWCYNYLRVTLLKFCPGSFTLGEAAILTQSIVLFLLSCEFSLFRKVNSSTYVSGFRDIPSHVKCLQVLLLGCLLLIYLLHAFPTLRRGVYFLGFLIVISILMLIAWSICLGENIFTWLFMFCVKDKKRVYLILFWLVCTLISVLFVVYVNLSSLHSGSTSVRKVFHFIITAVFVPGILHDLELLRLASGIALAVFLMLEMCRILKIPVIGLTIENAFQIFLDEKDTGLLILTHIYLLIGCSCPVWLHCYNWKVKGNHVSLFSGIISVGIGDTIAAICGKSFGRHKWRGSNKTIEGSFCGLVMQMIFAIFFLYLTGHSFHSYNIVLLTLAVVLTTYLEAKTNQVDNLVLPLFMFSILSWIR